MFFKQKQKQTNNIDVIFENIRKIRLLADIINHQEEIEEKKPEEIAEGEGFFKANFKKIKNTFKSDAYQKASESLNAKVVKFNEISNEQISSSLNQTYLKDMIEKISEESTLIAKDIFKDDSYKVGKIEFVMNVLCDNFVEYENNEEANAKISLILGEDEEYVDNILEELAEAYQRIGIKANGIFNKELELPILTGLAALVIGNPLISVGIIGLSLAECVTTLCGLKVSFFNNLRNEASEAINNIQKERLLNEFYNLNVEQTAFYLAKSTVLLLQINKFRASDPVAQEIYESYVENYIDIKSDITLKMLLDGNIEENLDKAKVFNNVDIYLATKLQAQ